MATKLVPLPIVRPGWKGLNTQEESSILGFEWATEAYNCVFDSSGRLASRKGWVPQNTTSLGEDVEQLFEYIDSSGNSYVIVATTTKVYHGVTSQVDITSSSAPTAGNWKFQNFNGKVVGWQAGHSPIVWTNTGTFTDIATNSGTMPTGSTCLSAFGRMWAVDADGVTLRYSALLDETRWAGADGGGLIDLTKVWPIGTDEVVALADFSNQLVIFGKNSILVYDGAQDPTTMGLVDSVAGIGCIARDSVQNVGTDILYLSRSGVRSFGRTILQNKMPMQKLTKHVEDFLALYIEKETFPIRSVYSETYGFYLVTFPTSQVTFCLDLRQPLQDGALRTTVWNRINPLSMVARRNRDLLIGKTNYVGLYDGWNDNGTSYTMNVKLGWTDLREFDDVSIMASDKMLKRLTAVVKTGYVATFSLNWYFDFSNIKHSQQDALTSGTAMEWGSSEWARGEWSGGYALHNIGVSAAGTGKHIQVGFEANVSTDIVALQQMSMFVKIGKRG